MIQPASSALPIRNFWVAGLATGLAALGAHVAWSEPMGRMVRDSLGHIGFAHLVCAAAMASPWIAKEMQPFVDLGSPSLAGLGKALPGVVFLQIVLGAGYRNEIWGFLPHLLGAIVVSGLLLYITTGVFTPSPVGSRSRRAAGALLWITVAQIGFGVWAYYSKASHAHILTGGLTFGFSLLLSVLLKRDVRGKA